MKKHVLGVAVILSLLVASSSFGQILLFDMGSGSSPLRSGFTRVTANSVYTQQAGFGWRSAEGLQERVRDYGREWVNDPSRGRDQPPPIYTNEITCDTIVGRQANAFLVDVPPGQYRVWLLGGLSEGATTDYHDWEIAAGDARSRIKIPGPYRFENRVLAVTVQNGPLAIELAPKTDWLLSALVICPSTETAKVQAEILDPLEKEIYFLPPDVASQWKEEKYVDDRPMPELSQTDRRRGYALFARHWSEVIWPNTVPRPEELNPELKTFASLGEYEPVTFTVLALEDLREARVTASDLICGERKIANDQIDIRYVRYMLVRPNYSMFFSYHLAPDVLEHRESAGIPQGRNQRFWITVHVPEDAAPGVYQGKLAFRAAGRPSADVPVSLRVLPIRLKKNPEHIYGAYYRDPLTQIRPENSQAANAYFLRKAELERQDMVAHGMNSHTGGEVGGMSLDDQGRWVLEGESAERRMRMDRKYGLAGKPLVMGFPVGSLYGRMVDRRGLGSHMRLVRPDVPQAFYDEVTRMVMAIEQERKRRDWPEFLYYPIDEPGTEEASVRFMANVLKAIKQVPAVRTYVTADPSKEAFEPLWPYVDVWCCQPFVFGYDKIKQLSKEKNIEFWCYPNHISGENDHTPIRGARMTFGFGFWKSGFRTLIPWIYQSSGGDPWNYLDSSSMDFYNRSTPDGEPIPVAMWEASREGIDDGRYLYTLEQLVAEGKRRGGRAAQLAAEAEKELKYAWNAIEVQEKYKYDKDDVALRLGALPPASDLWSGRDFDAYRWLLASRILALQEEMAGAASRHSSTDGL